MQAKLAEKAAMDAQEKIDSQALPIRAYLDQTVVPILLQGLSDLVKARLWENFICVRFYETDLFIKQTRRSSGVLGSVPYETQSQEQEIGCAHCRIQSIAHGDSYYYWWRLAVLIALAAAYEIEFKSENRARAKINKHQECGHV
jgi:hypothetical protein